MKAKLRTPEKKTHVQLESASLSRGVSDASAYALEPATDEVFHDASGAADVDAVGDDWTHRSSDDGSVGPGTASKSGGVGNLAETLGAALLGRRKRLFGN